MLTSDQLFAVIDEVEPTIRERYSSKLRTLAKRFDTDDLMQSVRLRAYRAIGSCEASSDDAELKHWVLKIAANAYKTEVETHVGTGKRSTKRESGSVELVATHAAVKTVDSTEMAESAAEIIALLNELPATQAKAVRMSYLDGREYSDIAAELGTTVNAVRLLVSRGLKVLRSLSTPYGFQLAADGTLTENPAEQNVIGAMQKLRARGWSYSQIAETATSRRLMARRGTTWTAAKVREILNAN